MLLYTAYLAKIKVLGVLPAHCPALEFVSPFICAGREAGGVCQYQGKDNGGFRFGLLYSYYQCPCFYYTELNFAAELTSERKGHLRLRNVQR